MPVANGNCAPVATTAGLVATTEHDRVWLFNAAMVTSGRWRATRPASPPEILVLGHWGHSRLTRARSSHVIIELSGADQDRLTSPVMRRGPTR